MTASLSRRGLAILLSAAILVALTALLPTMYAWWVGPQRQGLTLFIRLAGNAVLYASIKVFLLTDHGPVLLAVSNTYGLGFTAVHVFVPRVGDGFIPALTEAGAGPRRPIYASVNLEVFAAGLSPEGMVAGVKVFSIDPTYMRWPEDGVSVTVNMRRVPTPANSMAVNEGNASSGLRGLGRGVTGGVSWWQYTPVLRYGTWAGIREWFVINVGSKIEVESKGRICMLGACTPWEPAGSTQVTVDSYLRGKPVSGELVRTLYADIKYVNYTYCDSLLGVCEETIYAADTNEDFPNYKYVDSGWNGSLPKSRYSFYTYAGDVRRVGILGGYHWDLSVVVGANAAGMPPVRLGVTFARVPNPVSYLYVEAGRAYGRVVRTVSAHGASGGGGSYVVTYSRWVG